MCHGSLTFSFWPRVKKSLFGNRIGPLISFLRSSSTTMSATDASLSSDIANTARLRGCVLPFCCRKSATKGRRLLCAAADASAGSLRGRLRASSSRALRRCSPSVMRDTDPSTILLNSHGRTTQEHLRLTRISREQMIVQLDSHIVDFLKNDRLLTRGINFIWQVAEIISIVVDRKHNGPRRSHHKTLGPDLQCPFVSS